MQADGEGREAFDHARGRHDGRPVAGDDALEARAAFGQLADQVGAGQLGLQQLLAGCLQLQRDVVPCQLPAELTEQVAKDPARPVRRPAFAGLTAALETRRLFLQFAEDRQIMEVGGGVGHRCLSFYSSRRTRPAPSPACSFLSPGRGSTACCPSCLFVFPPATRQYLTWVGSGPRHDLAASPCTT